MPVLIIPGASMSGCDTKGDPLTIAQGHLLSRHGLGSAVAKMKAIDYGATIMGWCSFGPLSRLLQPALDGKVLCGF